MAKKVILKDLNDIEVLPITRGELILDASGNLALHSTLFLATDSLPGLMSSEDKYKLDNLENSGPEANNKVAQINTTTDDVYRLLFSETADDTDRTEKSRKSANLTFNPSTGVLNLTGAINANGGTVSGNLFVSNSYGGLILSNTSNDHNGFLLYNGNSKWFVSDNGWNNAFQVWHSGNDGHDSGLDADTLDGKHLVDFLHIRDGEASNYDLNESSWYKISAISWDYKTINYISNKPEENAGTVISFPGSKGFLMYKPYAKNQLWFRDRYENTWYSWKQIAFTSDIPTKISELENDSGYVTGGPYLPLSGGTITGSSAIPLIINSSTTANAIELRLTLNSANKADFGWDSLNGVYVYESTSKKFIGVKTDGTPYYHNGSHNTLIHSGNYQDFVGKMYWANVPISASSSTTTTPTFGLTKIKGGADIGLDIYTSSCYGRIRFYNASNSNNATIHYFENDCGGYSFVKDSLNLGCLGLVTLGGWNNPTLVVSSNTTTSNSDGKVGISTTSPSYNLSVGSSICANFNTNGSRVLLEPAAGGVTGGGIAFWGSSGWHNGTINASVLVLNNASGGYVGIGTANPSEKLQIAGNICIQALDSSTRPAIYLGHYTSWGSKTYPTLKSGATDQWVMHFNPHVCRSTTTGMPGSNIRMESVNSHYWDISIAHDATDNFRIRYDNSKNLVTISNNGLVSLANSIVFTGSIGYGTYLAGTGTDGLFLAANESGKKVFLESRNQDSPWFRNNNGDYQILHSGNYSSWALPALRMRNYSNGTSYHGAIPYAIALKAAGTPVYTDPEFASGNNEVYIYNNSGNSTVAITRLSDDLGSANSSGYILKIYNNGGTSSPGRGGFYQTISARQNAVFAQIFRAKIPTGFSVCHAENLMGNGHTTYWLTDTAGTGKWEWYIRITICGNGGSYSSGGYVYLKGSGAVTWYLAYCNLIDLTKGNYDGLRTKYADSASSATSASKATQVIMNLHTTNNVDYPIVWTNSNNANNAVAADLFKSYANLTYNPSAQRISVPNISLSTLNGYYKFYTTDVPEGAANLATTTTAHTMSLYRNGISIPYKGENSNDGGLLRVKGATETDCIFEMATWDDSGDGKTIQFNYYPTTSQVTPTYSVSVPKKSGTIALTSDLPPVKAYKWNATILGSTWSRLYTGNPSSLHHSSIFSVSGSIGCVVFSHTFLVESNHSTSARIIQLVGGSYTQFSIRTLVTSNGDVIIDMHWAGNDCSVGSSTLKMTVEINAICLSGSISPTTSFVSDASIPSGYSSSCSYTTRAGSSIFMELYAHGNVYGSHFYETSDAKHKTNIQSILDYDNIPLLRLFDWKKSGLKGYGLIALELELLGYYELVDTDDQGEKTVNYSAALSLIVGKLQVKIKELEKEIEILKNKN